MIAATVHGVDKAARVYLTTGKHGMLGFVGHVERCSDGRLKALVEWSDGSWSPQEMVEIHAVEEES